MKLIGEMSDMVLVLRMVFAGNSWIIDLFAGGYRYSKIDQRPPPPQQYTQVPLPLTLEIWLGKMTRISQIVSPQNSSNVYIFPTILTKFD